MQLGTHEGAQNSMFGVMYPQHGACRPFVHCTVISRTNIYWNLNMLFWANVQKY